MGFFAHLKERNLVLSIIIYFKWLKNHSMDPKNYKGITLQVSEPNFVFVDTARLLLIHGLLLGAFKDFRSWKDFKNIIPRESSSRIVICLEFGALSVFSAKGCICLSIDRRHPRTYHNIQRVMSSLSTMVGFEDHLQLYHI